MCPTTAAPTRIRIRLASVFMRNRISARVVCLSFVGLSLGTACGAEEAGSDKPGDGDGMDSNTEPGECSESPLFPPQAYGEDGTDLIRHVAYDSATQDIYYSILEDMYVFARGASEPELLGARPNDALYGDFWLADDLILYPSGFLVPLVEGTTAVLFSTDRTAGNTQVAVSLPAPPSLEYDFTVGQVNVIGDTVLWLGVDKYTEDPSDLLPEWETTFVVRRTSWTSPSEPEEIYSTTQDVRSLTVAGDKVFVEEEVGAEEIPVYEQTIVDLETGTVDPDHAEQKFGGRVVFGDDESLFVAQLDLDNVDAIGLFRMAHDGSGEERLTTNPFVNMIVPHADGYVFVDLQTLSEPIVVNKYVVGQGVTQIGCIDGSGTTAHSLSVADENVLVAIFRDNQSTILTFEN